MAAHQAKSYGTLIRELREERGMSRAELAEAIGMSPVILELVEKDRMRGHPRFLIRLARVFEGHDEQLADAYEQQMYGSGVLYLPEPLIEGLGRPIELPPADPEAT